jgi:hypothetical protein
MKTTPAPWTIKYDTKFGPDDRLVANCGGYSTNADRGEHRLENIANAHLVSAALDLLVELRALLDNAESIGYCPRCFRTWPNHWPDCRLMAALDKAAGISS